MNLHIKYRPALLDEVYGNEQTISSLQSLLNGGDPPHAYLFHGPTGAGKTTLGRIVAESLGAIGSDYREVDSAEFRGIDTIRDIRRQVQYAPMEGECRVWLLDEVHKLSNDAQNALLKALEDPPSHVYFILCTTDPQKMLATVKGRCSQHAVGPLGERDMRRLLMHVVKQEGDSLSKQVYQQIIMDSMGLPREALQILNKVLAVDGDDRLQIAKQQAERQSQTIELCRALTQGAGWRKVANILNGLKDEDPETIRRQVLGYCQAILLKEENNAAAAVMEEFDDPFWNSGFPALVKACYAIVTDR